MFSLSRRLVLTAFSVFLMLPGMARAAAPAEDPRLADLTMGRADAPVTIIEYSSYTCPHCATFRQEIRPWLIATFVKTGRARLVFSDYPLDGLSMAASLLVHSAPPETAEALSETLFSEQRQWGMAQNPRKALSALAGLAGMSQKAIDAALDDQALFQGILDKRKRAAKIHDVDSTPTLVINGRKIAANSSRKELTEMIEAAEAEAKVKP
ncbi:MAG: DsbA family protein [Rhodospirillaceae bacterium]|nr:DsbA family protein [Rhodospirillaceae bacterium]